MLPWGGGAHLWNFNLLAIMFNIRNTFNGSLFPILNVWLLDLVFFRSTIGIQFIHLGAQCTDKLRQGFLDHFMYYLLSWVLCGDFQGSQLPWQTYELPVYHEEDHDIWTLLPRLTNTCSTIWATVQWARWHCRIRIQAYPVLVPYFKHEGKDLICV